MELYAEAFEQGGAITRLEDFASRYGAEFYELPLNEGTIELEKVSWKTPSHYNLEDGEVVVPFRQERELTWKMIDK